jgi:4'-phosphopantetheinyl transferase
VTTSRVQLWRGRSPAVVDPADLAVLAASELQRFEGMVAVAGARFAGSRAAVRRILAGCLDVPPSRLVIGRKVCPGCGSSEHGPPAVIEPATTLEFSVSRSGDSWLVAVADGVPLGVDIEAAEAVDFELVSRLVMTPAELAALRSAAGEDARRSLFLRVWTRKEAVLKAAGIGLVAPLDQIDVQPTSAGPVHVTHENVVWSVQNVELGTEHQAAVATPADQPVELCWQHLAVVGS